jgi:phosphoribosylformimino-5-aminoimidazole carboxamide ribonucleotide (ProFAR) isomerase
MDVIPAIDLLGGQCVRLYQGDYAQAQIYSADPVIIARQWQDQGASRLHVVDLDEAKAGHPVNQQVIGAIAQALDIPVQVGGELRDRSSVVQLLELGVDRAIPVIASGGVSNLTDLLSLLALEPLGVVETIVGKALYTGDLSLKEAIRAVGPGRWQDVPPDLGFSALA